MNGRNARSSDGGGRTRENIIGWMTGDESLPTLLLAPILQNILALILIVNLGIITSWLELLKCLFLPSEEFRTSKTFYGLTSDIRGDVLLSQCVGGLL